MYNDIVINRQCIDFSLLAKLNIILKIYANMCQTFYSFHDSWLFLVNGLVVYKRVCWDKKRWDKMALISVFLEIGAAWVFVVISLVLELFLWVVYSDPDVDSCWTLLYYVSQLMRSSVFWRKKNLDSVLMLRFLTPLLYKIIRLDLF